MARLNPVHHRSLHLGSRGKDVRKVEEGLKERGLLKGPVDGFFGPRTKAAVQKLERQLGWRADGIVGNRLWRKLTGKGAEGAGGTGSGVTPSTTGGPHTFTTVNINVKSNPEMPQDKVVHDVRRASRQGSLIGWNEIQPDRYVKAIKDLGPEWGHYFPHDGKVRIPNPISWKKSEWKALDTGFERTHHGKEKTSPNRYITWALLQHRDSGQKVVRINTHLVSGAFSGKPNGDWRREKWHVHMEKLERMVARFEKQGYHVIVGGDFNRDSHKVLGNQVAYDNSIFEPTHGKSTLDYVMHVRDQGLKKVDADVQGGYASDHDAVIVKYALK